MRNYVEMFQCNSAYNVVYKVFTQISKCRKYVFAVAFLSAFNMKTRQTKCHGF